MGLRRTCSRHVSGTPGSAFERERADAYHRPIDILTDPRDTPEG
ncbi:hypothetical protein HD596_005937 [Nonomuraea jabiensis]|uniref:Uncharacterized protein n=1 Tax=Nonomuraea jabiensis TaxID=882448 RepID=A0A7W9G8P9_9ACTN|nr:hypothetical protein [Nonomuraea jabiensis]